MTQVGLDRRSFLARLGLLSAVASSALVLPGRTSAEADAQSELIDELRQILAEMARDTFNALAVFVVPGPDPYSVAQGTPTAEPGAIEAHTPEFLITMFDEILPIPDEMVRGIASALAGGLTNLPVPQPDDLPPLPPDTVHSVAEAVQIILTGPVTPPFSQIATLLLSLTATLINPSTVTGAFLTPYARLSLGEKAAVTSVLEDLDSPVMQAIKAQLPPDLQQGVPGLVLYLVGGLMAFSGFGAYSEWATFDPLRRSVSSRPVGWDICGYDPGVLDGWNDFQGYYQGRRAVTD
jgi:hypothetical protein